MKLFRSALLLLGETAALGWFILRDLSFLSVMPIIPLGVVFYFLHRFSAIKWLNGMLSIIAASLAAFILSVGVFDGNGFFTLLCLIPAVALLALNVPKAELERISGWWLFAFLLAFIVMLVATLPGVRWTVEMPPIGKWSDLLIFYLLVFLEPLGMGKDYRAAPLALGILLLPFGLAAYLALGAGAFTWAEYPYLSVWAGVAVSAFHHTEGIILCLYYGVGTLRLAHFLQSAGGLYCKAPKFFI